MAHGCAARVQLRVELAAGRHPHGVAGVWRPTREVTLAVMRAVPGEGLVHVRVGVGDWLAVGTGGHRGVALAHVAV